MQRQKKVFKMISLILLFYAIFWCIPLFTLLIIEVSYIFNIKVEASECKVKRYLLRFIKYKTKLLQIKNLQLIYNDVIGKDRYMGWYKVNKR